MNESLPIAAPVSAAATRDSDFLAIVGDRVRAARARKGISRRTLAERSGVSQRYLAQLEGGDGNISITLLRRIADALDHRIEWLVGEDDSRNPEDILVASLFRRAGSERRRQALRILDPAGPAGLRAHRLALIGLRGAGKSTLGKMLAAETGVPFLELNQEIARMSGMPVNEIIALYGQEGYRSLEKQAIDRIVAEHDSIILAVAGGIVSESETFVRFLRHFHTIWLKASPEEHMARARAQGDLRPMAGNPAALDELKSILTSREALYAQAEISVDTSGKRLEDSFREVRTVVAECRFLVE